MSALKQPNDLQAEDNQAQILDALLWVPVSFKDFTRYKTSVGRALAQGVAKAVFKLTIKGRKFESGERPRMHINAIDGIGQPVDLAIFDSDSFTLWKEIPVGSEVFVEAIPSDWHGNLQLKSPVLIPKDQQGRVVPVYKGRKGLTGQEIAYRISLASQAEIAAAVRRIEAAAGCVEAELIALAKVPLRSLAQLLLAMHAPRSVAEGETAILHARTLAARQIVHASAQSNARPDTPASVIELSRQKLNEFALRLPFKVSQEQIQAVKDIAADLAGPRPMNRILTGDVGTGKTAVFSIVAAVCQDEGRHVAILVPNQLLVDQIAAEFNAWWPEVPVLKLKTGDKIESLKNNPILIGTTALIFQVRKNKDWQADLIVVDEQHKQSTRIREALLQEHTNLLEATATPIPRSTALVAYSGMGVSVLRQSPIPKTIHTHLAGPGDREPLMRHLKQLVDAGGQVAVIYPRVSNAENQTSSVEQAAQMWERLLPQRVGVLHGRMTNEEKEATLAAMKARKFSCLIASTVVEVGVEIPDLVCLVVVAPDRYGVAQLHQMRGRVARKGGEGFFYMLAQAELADDARERLELLLKHNDGFTLAEKDAELRGFGDFSSGSDQQSGATRGIFESIRLMPADFQAV